MSAPSGPCPVPQVDARGAVPRAFQSGRGTVRAPAAGYYDGSLSSMLAELATTCHYGVPVRETTTVELLDLVLDAVRSAPSALISWRGAAQTATSTESQGGSPSRPGECRARRIARSGRLVSTVTAVPAHSRPEDGATAARLAARRRHKPTLDQAQTSGSRWPISSEGGWLMMVIAGTGPPAAHTSVGLITNAHSAPQSELTVTCRLGLRMAMLSVDSSCWLACGLRALRRPPRHIS